MNIRAAAVGLLARRDYFVKEMRAKLLQKEFPEQEVEFAIQELLKKGYLNDERLAERRIEKYRRKGYGSRWIAYKLQEESGKQFRSSETNTDAIASLLKKYSLKDPKERKKALAFLYRRGFSWNEVQSFFQESWQ